MSKHTPGPWSTGGTAFPGTDKESMNVWGPHAPGMQSGRMVAADCRPVDARLIAAAPELLEALSDCIDVIDLVLSSDEDQDIPHRAALVVAMNKARAVRRHI